MSALTVLENEIGKLTKFLWLPCAIDPLIALEAAVPALIDAFIDFNSPDLRHQYEQLNNGRSLQCDIKGLIKDAARERGGEVTRTTRYIFRSVEFVDRAIWWLFVADVVAEGLVNWTSMAMQLQGCKGLHAGNSSTQGLGATNGGGIFDANLSNGFQWVQDQPPFEDFAAQIDVPAGHEGHIAWEVVGKIGNIPCGMIAKITRISDGSIIDEHKAPVSPSGVPAHAVVFMKAPAYPTGTELYECTSCGSAGVLSSVVAVKTGFCSTAVY